MKAVILCGGLGTRLREETEFRPKPMVEVGGRPILWHIMKIYAHYGVNEFILCTGYKGEMIKEYFLNYEARNNDFTVHLGQKDKIEFHNAHTESGWTVTVADTGPETLTGGRLKMIVPYLGDDEQFMVTYGDGVADVDLNELQEFHKANGKMATITSVQIPSRFGVMALDDRNAVTNFAEKAPTAGWVSGGFFVFNRSVIDYFDDSMLEHNTLPRLAKDSQLAAYRHTGFWQPMDTFRESSMLNEMWDAGDAPWKVWSE